MSLVSLFEGELAFCENLLKEDVRNNSAWNHRYFAVVNTTGFTPEVVKREVDYTLDCISKAKHNESAWNYLRGLVISVKDNLSF
jgi:protein farnesyltransferase/geranylgeranyltransferase type-1 subunit alpha